MSKTKNLRVSIVIPVYNEAEYLLSCLQAIARQRVKPFEVIVVDNNSSDATSAVALSFPFVRLLHEPKQGVVHARNNGFSAASGEIIGRIDADTLLPPNWVAQVQQLFASERLSAVSGAPDYYDFALPQVANRIDGACRQHLARTLGNENFLFGANMAIRRSDWLEVQHELCAKAGIHEDFDLGIHLQQAGKVVGYAPSLVAGVSMRRIDSSFGGFIRYSLVSPKTYAYHGLTSRRHMYPVLAVTWACYLPGRILYRSFDQQSGRFTMMQLIKNTTQRVDPTVNVV
jgi:glycosyltransferase involved in cell wall biosynthesis